MYVLLGVHKYNNNENIIIQLYYELSLLFNRNNRIQISDY